MSSYAEDFSRDLGLAPEVAEAAAEIRKGWDAVTYISRSVRKPQKLETPLTRVAPVENEDRTYRDLY